MLLRVFGSDRDRQPLDRVAGTLPRSFGFAFGSEAGIHEVREGMNAGHRFGRNGGHWSYGELPR